MKKGFETVSSDIERDGYNLTFEADTRQEGKEYFEFKNVLVKIDRTGKNIDEYPELSFSTFDKEPDNFGMNQPFEKREGVDMDYISACIKRVAQYTGDEVFWMFPFSGDAIESIDMKATTEEKEKRENVRYRLFRRYANLEPGPNNYGYLIRP